MVQLSTLTQGQKGEEMGYSDQDSAVLKRLLEMGLVKGTAVEVVGFAPLGDPMEIMVRNYKLSIRLCEAELVDVKLLG